MKRYGRTVGEDPGELVTGGDCAEQSTRGVAEPSAAVLGPVNRDRLLQFD